MLQMTRVVIKKKCLLLIKNYLFVEVRDVSKCCIHEIHYERQSNKIQCFTSGQFYPFVLQLALMRQTSLFCTDTRHSRGSAVFPHKSTTDKTKNNENKIRQKKKGDNVILRLEAESEDKKLHQIPVCLFPGSFSSAPSCRINNSVSFPSHTSVSLHSPSHISVYSPTASVIKPRVSPRYPLTRDTSAAVTPGTVNAASTLPGLTLLRMRDLNGLQRADS